MNDIEAYQDIAIANSKTGRPLRSEEVDHSIPFFEVYRSPFGRYDIRGYNYESHDNAQRMGLWEGYMRTRVLPQIKGDVRGFYNIELHDSYTYLDKPREKYRGCLTFSRFKDDPLPILVPDPYAIQNWGGMLSTVSDRVPWIDKLNKACFYGTTTGKQRPEENQRIDMCLWSLKRPDLYDFRITKIAQMSRERVQEHLGENYEKLVVSPVAPIDQMRYKYHLMLDGNTCRFDIWNLLTNSVTLKYESKEMLWYYPFLSNGTHFIEVNKENMESKMTLSQKEAEFIVENAKRVAQKVTTPMSHMFYLASVFENMAANGK